jgi:hypothetical protein
MSIKGLIDVYPVAKPRIIRAWPRRPNQPNSQDQLNYRFLYLDAGRLAKWYYNLFKKYCPVFPGKNGLEQRGPMAGAGPLTPPFPTPHNKSCIDLIRSHFWWWCFYERYEFIYGPSREEPYLFFPTTMKESYHQEGMTIVSMNVERTGGYTGPHTWYPVYAWRPGVDQGPCIKYSFIASRCPVGKRAHSIYGYSITQRDAVLAYCNYTVQGTRVRCFNIPVWYGDIALLFYWPVAPSMNLWQGPYLLTV